MRRARASGAAAGAVLLALGCTSAAPSAVVVIDIPRPLPALPEPPEPRGPAPALLGHWEGVGLQESGVSWEMVVDLVAVGPGLCGRAHYPTVPCAADWICSGRSDGRVLHAREHLTAGRDECIEGGDMTMELTPEGTLSWRWTGSGEAAHALLSRSKAGR